MSSTLSRLGWQLLRGNLWKEETVECCGIVGYCGKQDACKVLSGGVSLLQNRGYDSCGITTLHKKKLVTTKYASRGTTSDSVEKLLSTAPSRHKGHGLGIAHTRWATHGRKTDDNAHPHHDHKCRISLVHNGTIDNFEALKDELVSLGIQFRSQTDTEVIANLIGHYLDQEMPFKDSVAKAVSRLRGTWGLVVIHKDIPNGMMCARNGSPLIVGSSECGKELFVASEPLAMAEYTNEYVALKDGDICFISTDDGIADVSELGKRDRHAIEIGHVDHECAPFTHWTIKEIYEQPQSLARALNFGARLGAKGTRSIKLGGLEMRGADLDQIKRLLLTGCGTSLYAAMYGELLMKHLECFDSVDVIDSSELDSHSFLKPAKECAVIALSQSGETRDVVQALEEADKLEVRTMSVVNQVGSLVARMTNCGVYLNAGREVAVASTKAYTSQVCVLALIAGWFAQRRSTSSKQKIDDLCDSLHRLPLTASQLLGLDPQCRKLAQTICNAKDIFVLGKGFAYPVALEGALKIKEVSYCHAEGFAGGQLKHGPFALIDEAQETPVIMLILKDNNHAHMLTAARQVKARGARVIAITDSPDSCKTVADDVIKIPSNGSLTALGAVVPLQMLAYHMAVAKDINPDKPRGLAKTVTTI